MGDEAAALPLRWGAVPTMGAALLFFGFGTLPALLLPTSGPLVEWVRDPDWFLLNVFALLMALLLPLALVALYLAQAESSAKPGSWAS